jgi:hypothetical protein
MTAAICASPIKGTHLRLVKVDACGVPVTGASGLVVVTKGFIQVTMSPQYEDGEEFFERTADGTACVNEKDDPTLKRLELGVQFCEVNPLAASYVLSARDITSGAPATGYGFALAEGQPTNRFSIEVWQKVAGSGACDPSGVQRYIYNAWPNVGAVQLQDYVVENGTSTLEFNSETSGASTLWGDGPGAGTSWLPAGFAVEADEHWLWSITTVAPPTEACSTGTL